MKISELVKELEKLLEEHGDKDVYTNTYISSDWETRPAWPVFELHVIKDSDNSIVTIYFD